MQNQLSIKSKKAVEAHQSHLLKAEVRGTAGNHALTRKAQGPGEGLAKASGDKMNSAEKRASTDQQLRQQCKCGLTECHACSERGAVVLGRVIQTKLAVSEPGDRYEQEADRIANQVMTKPVNSVFSEAAPKIQRFAEQPLRKTTSPVDSIGNVLSNPGRPLDSSVRQDMEQRFGQNFSAVRVHSESIAEESAKQLRAHAFTVGSHIVFGSGRFTPASKKGRQLIAHELTHVVQQRGAQPALMRQPDDEDYDEKIDASARAKEKERTEKRRRDRKAAGKQDPEDTRLTKKEAERELRGLENSYRQQGAKTRSLKRKKADLDRFEKLLPLTGESQLKQNQRKGAFDELQRTPSASVGDPQTKHVAGGAALPDQDLRAGEDRYAQPDYSFDRHKKDGTIERVHVNLKSDKIDMQSVAKAKETARRYLQQARRNARHLADDEKIIISFARSPTEEVQEAMKSVFFAEAKSPVSEIRFGTTTHRHADYVPPVGPVRPARKSRAQGKTVKSKTAADKATKKTTADKAKATATDSAKKAADKAKKTTTAKSKKSTAKDTKEPAVTKDTGTKASKKDKTKKTAEPIRTEAAKTDPKQKTTVEKGAAAKPEVKSQVTDVTKGSSTTEVTKGGPPAGSERTTTAQTGEPIEAVHTSGKGSAKGAAIEFGAQALLAAQLDMVRGAELTKAEEALEKLGPEIEDYRQKGYDVTVKVVAEVPDQVDIAAYIAGVGDPGQVVYFKKMFISSAVKRGPHVQSPGMRESLGGGDPDAKSADEMTFQEQLDAQLGKKYPVKGTAPRKGFHYESREQSFSAYTASELPGGRGLAGDYKPAFVNLTKSGNSELVKIYGMGRFLRVSSGTFPGTISEVLMIDATDRAPYSMTSSLLTVGARDSFGGRFVRREKDTDSYRIDSSFSYLATKDYDVLVEEAAGEDLTPQFKMGSKWKAQIVWVKN